MIGLAFLSVALVVLGALAYRYFMRVHVDRAPKDAHTAALNDLDVRLKAVEETLRSEGRMAGLRGVFATPKK